MTDNTGNSTAANVKKAREIYQAAKAREDSKVADEPIGMPQIPQSAQVALEYLEWLLEREGIKFRNGKTALHWHLVATVAKHIS